MLSLPPSFSLAVTESAATVDGVISSCQPSYAGGISPGFDSKACTESGGASLGSSTSRNLPGNQLWMWEGNVARCHDVLRSSLGPIVEDGSVRKDCLALCWAYVDIISFHEGGSCQCVYVEIFDNKAFEGELSAVMVVSV